jgi:hypothetical protein
MRGRHSYSVYQISSQHTMILHILYVQYSTPVYAVCPLTCSSSHDLYPETNWLAYIHTESISSACCRKVKEELDVNTSCSTPPVFWSLHEMLQASSDHEV